MTTFHERKAERTEHFQRFVNGWKQRACGSCSGSGHYDADGSPACGACNGAGKETFAPERPPAPNHFVRQIAGNRVDQMRFDIAYFAQPGIHIPKYRRDLDYLRPLVEAERKLAAEERTAAWDARHPIAAGFSM